MSEKLPASDSEAQSLRSISGQSLERSVAKIVTEILGSPENIYASVLKDIEQLAKTKPEYEELLEYARTPIRSPCNQNYVMTLPDTDIIAYYHHKDFSGKVLKRVHLATLSCKVSFKGRYTQAAFWGSILKSNDRKYVCVTCDKFDELGICSEGGTKARRILENFVDGVYLIKDYENNQNDMIYDMGRFYEIFQNSKFSKSDSLAFDQKRNESYCPQVRPFDDLMFNLVRWKHDFIEGVNRSRHGNK